MYLLEGRISVQVIWNSSLQEICLFSLDFFKSFILISVDHGYVFCTLGYNPVLVFCDSNCPSLHHLELFPSGSCVPSSPILLPFEHFLTFWHYDRWSRVVFDCCRLQVSEPLICGSRKVAVHIDILRSELRKLIWQIKW